jgi:tRNA pseudouridine55 synthase
MLNDANIPGPELLERLRDGFVLPIDKPAGITSFGVVARVKRLLPRGIKIGHAGTLDPFATGLLLLLIGKATRQCEAMMDQPKTYEATIRLGATSDTDDLTGQICVTTDPAAPARAKIEQRLATMIGDVSQRPPTYSAIKINGRRACDRVRQGQEIELQPRIVRIYAIELLAYAWPDLQVRIDCGRGTYIRSIARDLGESLGIGGYLTQLRRTRIGSYDTNMAKQLNDLASDSAYLYNPVGKAER